MLSYRESCAYFAAFKYSLYTIAYSTHEVIRFLSDHVDEFQDHELNLFVDRIDEAIEKSKQPNVHVDVNAWLKFKNCVQHEIDKRNNRIVEIIKIDSELANKLVAGYEDSRYSTIVSNVEAFDDNTPCDMCCKLVVILRKSDNTYFGAKYYMYDDRSGRTKDPFEYEEMDDSLMVKFKQCRAVKHSITEYHIIGDQ